MYAFISNYYRLGTSEKLTFQTAVAQKLATISNIGADFYKKQPFFPENKPI